MFRLKRIVSCATLIGVSGLYPAPRKGVVAPAAVTRRPSPQVSDSETSPRVERLRAAAKRSRHAVTEFWQEAHADGSPIIEALPDDNRHVLATFVYQGGPQTTSVTLSAQLRFTSALGENAFSRIPATDVWYRTYRVPSDLRFSYGLIVNSVDGPVQRDPFNPHLLPDGVGLLGPSVVELPNAPRQSWIVRDPAVRTGTLQELTVHSRVLGEARHAWVLVPTAYDPRRTLPYHLLLCFDGRWFATANELPTTLANLAARHETPEFIAVFVDQSPQPRRNIELDNNQPFLDFVTKELLPAVRSRWRATADPQATAACGGSSGGLAAAFAAYQRPDVFGNVLSESGAFWPGHTREDSAREWLTKQIAESPRRAVRFVLHVGVLEVHPTVGRGPSILTTNRHLRDVLASKGYDLRYAEVPGGHEPLSWRGGLAHGLIALFGHSNGSP